MLLKIPCTQKLPNAWASESVEGYSGTFTPINSIATMFFLKNLKQKSKAYFFSKHIRVTYEYNEKKTDFFVYHNHG
jgi:hypothetical protein